MGPTNGKFPDLLQSRGPGPTNLLDMIYQLSFLYYQTIIKMRLHALTHKGSADMVYSLYFCLAICVHRHPELLVGR